MISIKFSRTFTDNFQSKIWTPLKLWNYIRLFAPFLLKILTVNFKLSFIHRILCKLFSLCESSLQIFPIICHMSLSPFDWLIYWLHNYWDDYRRRHWRIWFIFINKVNNTTVATLSVTTWTDWCHLNSVLPHGRLTMNHMRFFRTSARQTFTGEVTLLQSILSKLRVLK